METLAISSPIGVYEALAGPIIEFPLGTAVVLLMFGKYMERFSFFGRRITGWTGWLATAALARSFVAAVVMLFELMSRPEGQREVTVRLFDWFEVGSFKAGISFLVDPLSATMCLVVTGVGTLIFLYSIGYMRGDDRYPVYFGYFSLFAASMLLLVLADNLALLYVGWEGVGLCSYLLIGYWFTRDSAANAAKKAFVVNRIGDFAFLIGIFLAFQAAGSVFFLDINHAAEAGLITTGIATAIALLVFAGATGKSAQIPLYVWLPDAMEGPTPVSALIHAATMVTAGVYVVARLAPVFDASGSALMVVAWIGALTALWAALMACAEYDIKRVLAYSTVSQIGYMFLAEGVGSYSVGIFHLVTHAFFKALLFLGAGAVMHALADATDMRTMGGLRKKMPVTGLTFLVGTLAISGIVPFSGFFSKDAILASAWAGGQYALWVIGLATALVTAFYMFRLYFRVFEGGPETETAVHAHEAGWVMAGPLVVLALGAFAGGVVNFPGVTTLQTFLEPVVGLGHEPAGLLPWLLAGVALLIAVAGIAAARTLYVRPGAQERRVGLQERFSYFVTAARNRFWVDEAYGRLFVLPGKRLSDELANAVDPRFFDGIVNGTAWGIARSSESTRRLQTGYVRNYALMFLLGVLAISTVFVLGVTIG